MLPNWLYGKSKSKLANILGGGGTPTDYEQVKAKVTQNTEDIEKLTDELTNYLVQKDYNFVSSDLSEKQNGAASFDAGTIGTRGCRCTWDISDEINSGLVPISSMITDFFDSTLYFSQPSIDINNKIIKLDIYRSTANAVSSARTQIRITYAKKNFMATNP